MRRVPGKRGRLASRLRMAHHCCPLTDQSPETDSNDTSAGEGARLRQFKPVPLPCIAAPPGEPLHRPVLPSLQRRGLAKAGPLRSAVSNRRRQAARRHERGSFAKSPQPTSRASGPYQNSRPHDALKISPTSAAPGKPLALRLPAARQRRPTPHRPAQVGTTRPRAPLTATIHRNTGTSQRLPGQPRKRRRRPSGNGGKPIKSICLKIGQSVA
jgi:hypothetical protein